MQRLPRDSFMAAEVERRGEPSQRPAPRLVVRAFPIRNPEQFLRQHCADARAPLAASARAFRSRDFSTDIVMSCFMTLRHQFTRKVREPRIYASGSPVRLPICE
jgi:hypothetical protein